jgi:tetratricopeptide (TPR) repeat protein
MNAPSALDVVAMWDFGNPGASEAKFRDLAANADHDAETRAEALTQAARALGLQSRFDEAEAMLRRAEGMVMPGMHRAGVRVLLERGRVLNSSGRKDEARPLFIEAWEAAREARLDALAVDAAHMVAIVEARDEALAWNERALEVARASDDPAARRWLGSLCNNIGWTYHDAGRFEEALAMFRLALDERQRQGKPGQVLIARWCVARALRSVGRVEEALAGQRQLLAEHAAAGTSDGFVHEEIGECLLLLGRAGEAGPHFAAAHGALSLDDLFAKAQPERLARLARMGSAGSASRA